MKHIPRILVEQKIGLMFHLNETINLDAFDTNHLKNVLKIRNKEHIIAFNDLEEWECELIYDTKISKILMIKKLRENQGNCKYRFHIFFALFKKQDLLIEKTTEIGADYFHPIISDFANFKVFNSAKYEKIAKQALEQSNRIGCVKFNSPVPLSSIYNTTFPIFTCVERSNIPSISTNVRLLGEKIPQDIGILIGPEGGFSANEISSIKNCKNFISSSVGDNILRSETAGICALGILKDALNNR